MQPSVRHAILASVLTAGCAARLADAGTEAEVALRTRLQAAHDATLRLELHGRLDAGAIARGVREVQAWCDFDSMVVNGSVDANGTLSIAAPTIEVHDRCATIVHVVDQAGAHWYCWLDLTRAPPTGRHDLGELHLQREPEALVVVDNLGRPLANARVLLHQQYPEAHPGLTGPCDFETCTDVRGCTPPLCRAAPFDTTTPIVVRHEDFAPWWGQLTPRVELDHGGEIRGRVVLPARADPADFAVGVWVDEASPGQGYSVYANVTALLAPNGTYRLRNVPLGRRTVHVQDRQRHEYHSRGSRVEVDVGRAPTTAEDLTIEADGRACVAMRLRLTGHDGRAVLASHATIHISDVGIRVPLHDGYIDWVGDPSEPFAIDVAGYGITSRSTHRSGAVFRLQGGYRVALRLAIDAARRLPPACALRATVTPITEDTDYFGREPALYLDRPWYLDDETPLGIARDAPIIVDSPCRYRVDLEMIRWDVAEGQFTQVPIDVEPSEFEVHAENESTLVTVTSRFVDSPH